MLTVTEPSLRIAHDVQMAMEEVDRSLQEHHGWLDRIKRASLGGTALSTNDLADDAHRRCCFGRWLYDDSGLCLDVGLAIAPIEEDHMRVHGLARQILRDVAMRRPTTPMDVQRLGQCFERMRDHTYTVKSDLRRMLVDRQSPARRSA